MEGSLLSQGLNLMLIGMGTVFMFLTLLVFTTRAMSAIVMRLQPDVPTPDDPPATPAAANSSAVVAAITAALHLHRSKKN